MKAKTIDLQLRHSIALACLAMLAGAVQPVAAQNKERQSDVMFLAGYNQLTNGYTNQGYVSAIGNTISQDGLGMHAEVTYADREESGALFLGGLSYNSDRFAIKAMAGTSTDVTTIFPDSYARLSMEFRGDAASGWIVNPAYSVRHYRLGLTDQIAELRLVKYLPAGPDASVIVEVVGREGFLDPGPQWVPSALFGVTYAKYKTYSFGVAADVGRAEYDSLTGPGSVNEPYYAIRPSVAMNIDSSSEIFARADYTHRESYQSTGFLAGIKFTFGQ